MIAETEVTLSAGSVAFMGDFVVDQSLGLKDADATQRHLYALFGGGDEREGFSRTPSAATTTIAGSSTTRHGRGGTG